MKPLVLVDLLSYSFPKSRFRIARLGIVLAGLTVLVACGPREAVPVGEPFDPFEEENRKMHAFNKSLDKILVRPLGKGYSGIFPDELENLINRFAFNISIPGAIVNNVLQGNMKGASEDLYRFTVNSTIGLGGLFDTASELSMPTATKADFGQTLHVWGVPQGAYIELPILGASTERDTVGKVVDLFTNPLSYVIPSPQKNYTTGASLFSRLGDRGRFAETVDSILYDSADSYAQARSLYLQNRAFELGKATGGAYVDPYDDPYSDPYEDPYDE